MDKDVIDDVNALLKLGVGDAYRLEHIKQSYMQNKTVWITDSNYLQKLKDKYLVRHAADEEEPDGSEEGKIHCWKCGRKVELGANFCMACGSALFEVGTETQRVDRPKEPADARKMISPKLLIMILVPVVALLAIGGAYAGGVFDAYLERSPAAAPADAPAATTTDAPADAPADPGQEGTGCGPGLVLNDENTCVLPADLPPYDPDDPSSQCGPGLVYDEENNWCIPG